MTEVIFSKIKDIEVNIYPLDEAGAIIYDVNSEQTHVLNETAKYLYDLLDKPMNITQIVEVFKTSFQFEGDDLANLEDDLFEVLDELTEKALIISNRVDIES